MTAPDRDIRLSLDEITALREAARARARTIAGSICRAEESARAGATIQQGTLDRHYAKLTHLNTAISSLEAAERAIARKLAALVLGERGAA